MCKIHTSSHLWSFCTVHHRLRIFHSHVCARASNCFRCVVILLSSGKNPHDKMYQIGILHGLRRLSKTQEQIIRKIQVGVRPVSHSSGNFCHTHAVVLKGQDSLLHVNRRSFLKAHAKKVRSGLRLNMPFFFVYLSINGTIVSVHCLYQPGQLSSLIWLDTEEHGSCA